MKPLLSHTICKWERVVALRVNSFVRYSEEQDVAFINLCVEYIDYSLACMIIGHVYLKQDRY